MTAPRYQDVTADAIPEVHRRRRHPRPVIAGEFWGSVGPWTGIAADPLAVWTPAPQVCETFHIDTYRRAFAYIFQGWRVCGCQPPPSTECVAGKKKGSQARN
jgi:redox-sensitive bicupin YhaK (pirin superfamily)